MPHPFAPLSTEWPGSTLIRRMKDRRQRRRANAMLEDALGSLMPAPAIDAQVRQALALGADPNHAFGNTPLRALEWAVEHRRFALVVDLLDAGAHPDPVDGQRLPTETLRRLYNTRLDVTLFTASLLTLAHALHHGGKGWLDDPAPLLDALNAFVEHGANPWRIGGPQDERATLSTPLHLLAFEHPSLSGVPVALLHRLDPSRVDQDGNTAAHVVARHGAGSGHVLETADVSKGLLALAQVGVALDGVRNREGDSPLDLLVKRVNPRDLPPTALSLLHTELPDLRWDQSPPHGGPSPLAMLQTLRGQTAVLDRLQAAFLTDFLDEEEHRILRRAADETIARQPDGAGLARSRSRL